MLVTSFFSFSHNVFQRFFLLGRYKSGMWGNELNYLQGEAFRKHCQKRRKCWLPAFSPFPNVFYNNVFTTEAFWKKCERKCWVPPSPLCVKFILSYANALSMDWSKMLALGRVNFPSLVLIKLEFFKAKKDLNTSIIVIKKNWYTKRTLTLPKSRQGPKNFRNFTRPSVILHSSYS